MVKPLLFLSFFISVLSSNAQTTVVDSIFVNSNGMYRSYRLYIPAIYNGATPRPLIFNIHGYTSNALQQQYYSNFEPIADTANFLMVYPQGTIYSGQTFWNAGLSPFAIDDIDFLSNLIDSLASKYNINLNRVYSCGMSNGGFMSQTLACELSNRITAIASVTGSIFNTQYGQYCHPTRPVPVMQISGTADATVPYSGSSTVMPIDSVIKYWVKKNNCNPTAVFSNVPNTNTGDGCTAEHYVYNNGNSGSTVELYKVIGGGHTWPGSPFTIGVTNQDFFASKEIWRFFNQYNLSSLTGVSELNYKNDFLIYPNPSADILNIEVEKEISSIEITDALGNVFISEATHNNSISVEKLNAGIYFLSIKTESGEVETVKFIKEE